MVPDRYSRVRIGRVHEWRAGQILKQARRLGVLERGDTHPPQASVGPAYVIAHSLIDNPPAPRFCDPPDRDHGRNANCDCDFLQHG